MPNYIDLADYAVIISGVVFKRLDLADYNNLLQQNVCYGALMKIIGRNQEVYQFERLLESKKSELLVVYGRRRVGKTFLINQYFKNKGIYFELSGIYQANIASQLQNFAQELSATFTPGASMPAPKNWQDAFEKLQVCIKKMEAEQRIILFFDEVPWLASPKSSFLVMLEHCWNRYLSRDPRIILILCGSAASWMIKKIIQSRGGFHGRITQQLQLLPFNLAETKAYLDSRKIIFDFKQLVELYICIGGIPKYLSLIERGQSVRQSINKQCFTLQGSLLGEFNALYHSLFNHAEKHIAIIKVLAKHPEGLSLDVLLEQSKLKSGGTASDILFELISAGFIVRLPNFNQKSKNTIFKLIDEYSLFYLRWIEPRMQHGTINTEIDYWLTRSHDRSWQAWAGFAFESICWKHIREIKNLLGIGGVATLQSAWRGSYNGQHAQIDLIIDRQDQCINLCEIKFSDNEFELSKSYVEKLKQKKIIFQNATQTKKSIIMTLITTYGCKKNDYYFQTIDNDLQLSDFF